MKEQASGMLEQTKGSIMNSLNKQMSSAIN